MAWWRRKRRQRIFIVPTPFGVSAGLLLVGVSIFASATNSSAALSLCAVLLLAGMLAIFQTNGSVSDVKVLACRAEDVPVGKPIPLRMTLLNSSRQPKLMLHLGIDRGFWRRSSSSMLIELIPPGESLEVLMYAPAKKRGVHAVPKLALSSRFPLGVCKAWVHLKDLGDMVVYPEPKGVTDIPLDAQLTGEKGAKRLDDGDFWGHRGYREGDSLAHVDWKAHARGRGMQTKQYAYGSALSHALRLVDAQGDSLEGKLQQLSLWVQLAVERDQAFSLELPQRVIAAGHGARQFRLAMRALAEVDGGDHDATH